MKSRYLKVGFCIIMFFSLVSVSNLILRPIYYRVGVEFENLLSSTGQKIKEKTGLEFSYESLSLSILRGVTLNGILVFDSKSKTRVASIRSISVAYSLESFFKGETDDVLKNISLNDIEIEVVEGKNDFWIEGILQILKSGKTSQVADSVFEGIDVETETTEESFSKKLDLEKMNLSFLNDIRVYRMHLIYKKGKYHFEGDLSKAFFSKKTQDKIDARIDGNLYFQIGLKKISSIIHLSTSLLEGFDGSSAVLRFRNFTVLNYNMRYLGFVAEYKNKKINLKMLPSSQNIYAEFNAALETGDLSAKILADNFSLSKILQASNQKQLERELFAMNFSIDGEAEYNINTKKFSYSAKGNAQVPGKIIPVKKYAENANVSFFFSGNKTRINVRHFQATSRLYNLKYNGNFNLKKMLPEGNLYIDSLILPNGGEFSSEVFIEPQSNGFMCFAPQINFGTNTFTAAQLNVIPTVDAWDFTFEVSDYSHLDSEKPGVLSLFGSFAPSTKAVQTSVSFDTVYVDSIINMYAFFADPSLESLLGKTAVTASDYIFTCDSFASISGNEYVLSVPYAFIASTVRDDQMLMLSADGNLENIHLSRLELVFAKQHLLVSGDSAFLGKEEGRVMNGRLEFNDIPYNFTGLLNQDWVSISAEYGLQFMLNTDTSGKEAVVSGSFTAEEFPVKINELTYSLSNESSFSYSVSSGINVQIPRFEGRVIDKTFLNPFVSFSGNLNSQGLMFENVSYADKVSTLAGNANVLWSTEKGVFKDATFMMSLSNLDGFESVMFSGNVINTDQTRFSLGWLFSKDFFKNLLLDVNLNINSLRSQRFVTSSHESDSLNATLSIQGMVSNPFVVFSIPRAAFTFRNTPLLVTVDATLEDMLVNVENLTVDFGVTQIQDFTALFDIRKFSGGLKFDFTTEMFGKKISTDVVAAAEVVGEVVGGVPNMAKFTLSTTEIIENGLKKNPPMQIDIMKVNNDLLLSSSQNIGISGTISNYKDIDVKIKNPLPFEVAVKGTASHDNINLLFSDIRTDLAQIDKTAKIEIVQIKKGILEGSFAITGTSSDPCFSGELSVLPSEFTFPKFFTKKATADKITLIMEGSEFYTRPTVCHLHRTPILATVNVQMNRFMFESLDVQIQTIEENFVPLNINLPEIHVKGDFLTDININYEDDKVDVSGDVVAKNANAEFGVTRLNEIFAGFVPKNNDGEDVGSTIDVDLKVKAISRVQISYNSFLRAAVVPGTEIEVAYIGEQKRLLLDGEVPVKGGEISYLNTNFYIKKGSVHFSENDEGFDPRITIRAETKLRDNNNELITISLIVDNQYLSELSPRIIASPARTEREIIEILGGIISGNAEDAASFALAVGDYSIQQIFTRKFENALRDFFKFDIFSVRTMVVQNAVKLGMSGNSVVGTSNSVSASNYLDGTTVYIGKYFGDSIFVDGMLKLEYDKNRVGDKYTLNGLSFRPEVGFSLESPYTNIRLSMSPEFDDLINMRLVQNTALTLSWKINF